MVGQRLKPGRLLLIGVAVSMALNALSTMVMLRLPDSQYAFVQNWIAGSLWGADWQNAGLLTLGILVFGGYAVFCSWTLNVLGLGEEAARGLGVDVQRVYRRFLIAACALSALACAAGESGVCGTDLSSSGKTPGGLESPSDAAGSLSAGRGAAGVCRHHFPDSAAAGGDSRGNCVGGDRRTVFPVSAGEETVNHDEETRRSGYGR